MKAVLRFLGSVYFAILLIAAAAIFVMAGTFIESRTQSHLYAEELIYKNPLFLLLLSGFFINILFSALRRWPFQSRHIPFLLTHLGLLMIIGGVMIKNVWGIQGKMALAEGGASSTLLLDNTQALQIEWRHPKNSLKILSQSYPLKQKFLENITQGSFSPHIEIINYHPHATEVLEGWIKNNLIWLNGFPPFPVFGITKLDKEETIPSSGTLTLTQQPDLEWTVKGVQSDDFEHVIQKTYVDGLQIIVGERRTQSEIAQGMLERALDEGISIPEGQVKFRLHFPHITDFSADPPYLIADFNLTSAESTTLKIPLYGKNSLLNQNLSHPDQGIYPFTVDLQRKPLLLFIKNESGIQSLIVFDKNGAVSTENLDPAHLSSFWVYNEGYGGYGLTTEIFQEKKRKDKEELLTARLENSIKALLENSPAHLAPPLTLLQKRCETCGKNLASVFLSFLKEWAATYQWLYIPQKATPELQDIFTNIDWSSVDPSVCKGCFWASQVFQEETLPKLKAYLKVEDEDAYLHKVLLSLFEESEALSTPLPSHFPRKAEESMTWFSAYLRAYSLHLSELLPNFEEEEFHAAICCGSIECPLTLKHIPLTPHVQKELNQPCVEFKMTVGTQTYEMSSLLDPSGKGMKWPTADGRFLVSFQPLSYTLPYKVRLRDARQMDYPESSRVKSYEGDFWIHDLQRSTKQEMHLSMNEVFETTSGYRFYLSQLYPPTENTLQKVQLVVNYDPAKYVLTYPGGMILGFGITGLFWGESLKRLFKRREDKNETEMQRKKTG